MNDKLSQGQEKLLIFACGGVISLALYLGLIWAYTNTAEDPIIFFASLVMAGGIFCLDYIILHKMKLFDDFTNIMMCLVYFMSLIIFIVFAPTFIDRSLSYHIAFYAADEQSININEIKEEFSTEIFDKRIHDATVTGFITEDERGYYRPTIKAEIMTAILKPIGKMTGSLHTYEKLRKKLTK